MKLAVESQLEIPTLHFNHLTRWQSQTVSDSIWRSWTIHAWYKYRISWLVWYCTARLILVTWSRPNLIIGLIFPVGKKDQLGKKILLNVLSLRFSFYQINYQHLSHTNRIKTWEELNTICHISSYVHQYGYLGTLNYTGIEQVIQWTTWRFWILFHKHYDYLYFLYKILFNTVYTCRFNI